jgi:hypothetical protein
MIMERGVPSPQMEQMVKQLASRHGMEWSQKGTRLTLAMPTRTDCWLIVNLDGVRISVTHCWAEGDNCLAPDVDMVFVLYPDGWEPVELLHTDAVWNSYVQTAKAAGIPIYDGKGDTIFAHFTEYWAHQLHQQGWLESSYKVEDAKGSRFAGCQSVHTGPCYGELWQCTSCEKTVCYAEGTTHHPGLCDDCWSKQHAVEDEDVPF